MFIVSSGIGSWPLGVILTVRRAVFIWGETDVMVPWIMVPMLNQYRMLIEWSSTGGEMVCDLPFLSSMVTVSLAHFIKNLVGESRQLWILIVVRAV